jgi:hypothetical protein
MVSTSPTQTIPGSATLAPSEVLSLYGALVAPRKGKPALETPQLPDHSTFNETQLGVMLVAAAMLTLEQRGSVRLHQEQKKVLFGLRKKELLYMTATDTAPNMAVGCWETLIYERLLKAKERTGDVADVVYGVLATDGDQPWHLIFDVTLRGLARRQLLTIADKKVALIFHSRRYVLPESTAALAQAQDVPSIRQLLTQTEQERPAVWAKLAQEIANGVGRRQETDDSGPD